MKSQNGFTLIELIIVLAIAMVLLTIGIPSFKSLIDNNRLATSTNTFVAALMMTRSEAIKRNKRVTLCRTADQVNCASATGGYQTGWIIFAETDISGTCTTGAIDTSSDCNEQVIRVFEGFPGNMTIMATGTNANDVEDYVSYNPMGRVDRNGIICSSSDECQFTITIGDRSETVGLSSTGRVQ